MRKPDFARHDRVWPRIDRDQTRIKKTPIRVRSAFHLWLKFLLAGVRLNNFMLKQRLRAVFGLLWGLALFLAITSSLKIGFGDVLTSNPALWQGVLKATVASVAVIVWKLMGRPLSDMGWRKARWWDRTYLVWFAIAAIAMIAASVVAILLGVRHPVAAQLSFLHLIALIWLLSSFSEEVYVRGLVQSWMDARNIPCAATRTGGRRSSLRPVCSPRSTSHSCGRRWVSREVW